MPGAAGRCTNPAPGLLGPGLLGPAGASGGRANPGLAAPGPWWDAEGRAEVGFPDVEGLLPTADPDSLLLVEGFNGGCNGGGLETCNMHASDLSGMDIQQHACHCCLTDFSLSCFTLHCSWLISLVAHAWLAIAHADQMQMLPSKTIKCMPFG